MIVKQSPLAEMQQRTKAVGEVDPPAQDLPAVHPGADRLRHRGAGHLPPPGHRPPFLPGQPFPLGRRRRRGHRPTPLHSLPLRSRPHHFPRQRLLLCLLPTSPLGQALTIVLTIALTTALTITLPVVLGVVDQE